MQRLKRGARVAFCVVGLAGGVFSGCASEADVAAAEAVWFEEGLEQDCTAEQAEYDAACWALHQPAPSNRAPM
jgi:hypothetical protein